jgi:hypothetical protein
MIRKFLSLATAIGILCVYLQSQLHSDDALFLVTSSNIVLNLAMLGVACLAVRISYKDKFKAWESYLATVIAGGLLAFIGTVGIIYTSWSNYFSGLIKPVDYFIFLELGIIYGIISLTYSHPPIKLKAPAYNYSLAGLRIKQQLSGLMERTVIMPGRDTPGPHAV